MKKLVLTSLAMAAGVTLSHAQGTISLNTTAAEVYTNGASIGEGIGAAAGSSQYDYEVLDMTSSAYAALTSGQQAGVYDLIANESDLSLWTDSGVSGTTGLQAGSIKSATTSTANNWAAPTSSSGYTSAASYDYYTIIGWNSALGSWATVEADLNAGTLGSMTGFFGQTAVAYNYAGGGASGLGAVGLFDGSAVTGLAGSGGLPSSDALTLYAIPVPEPTTLALAGLGGLSMLFLRRRKA